MSFYGYFESMSWSSIIVCVIVTVYLVLNLLKKPKNFPPGPVGVPILGVAPFVSSRPEITFASWSKRYGDIIGFKVGSQYTVVLNSYEAIKECLLDNALYFNHCPENFLVQGLFNKQGIAWRDYTPDYIVERKFDHTSLSRLGFGRKKLEQPIMDEALYLVQDFGSGEVVLDAKIIKRIMLAAANVVSIVSAAKRYKNYDEDEIRVLMDGMMTILRDGTIAYQVSLLFPWALHIPPVKWSADVARRGVDETFKMLTNLIEEHEKTLDDGNPRDFIDEYLIEMRKNLDENKKIFTKESLRGSIHNLYGAGMETSSTTVVFSCLVLANRPDIMKKVHAEIDNFLGSDGRPHFVRREIMPYCHAFLREIMRFRTIVPFLLPHCAAENVTLRNFNIPKGTTVLPNIYAVHNDSKYWENPDEFIPERHIGEDGKVNLSIKYLLPFGIGPRMCIGRNLAEMEMFIFFVTIFQRYDVIRIATSNCKRPVIQDDGDKCGATLAPPEHSQVVLVPRRI